MNARRILKTTIDWILFLAGVATFFIGVIWAFREPGYESILACLLGIVCFVSEYLLNLQWNAEPRLGARPSKRALKDEVARLGIVLRGGNERNVMHEAINKEYAKLQTTSKRIIVAKLMIATLSVILIWPTVYWLDSTYPSLDTLEVDVELRWYTEQDGQKKIVEAGGLEMHVGDEDVENNRLSIPVNLAIRNKERKRLRGVKLEMLYPTGAKVESSGGQRLSVDDSAIVFQHDIGDLDPSEYFTPLSNTKSDSLSIPYSYGIVKCMLLTKEGVPAIAEYIVGQDLIAKGVVNFWVNLNADGRKKKTGRLSLTPRFGLKGHLDFEHGEPAELDEEARQLFAGPFPNEKMICSWTARFESTAKNASIGYCEFHHDRGHIQVVSVDQVVRRIAGDYNGDHKIDFLLWDEDADGKADRKFIWREDWPMLSWKKEWVETQPKNRN